MQTETENDEVVMTLVAAALERAPPEREAYLRSACQDSDTLFEATWQRVQWEERMGSFLLHPLIPRPELERPFRPGDVLSQRFRVVREVAHGGMGVVYEAVDQRLNRRIAIKCARPGYRGRLPPEARNAREISHPNVCKLHDIHTGRTRYGEIDFLSMEFLEGETLAQRIRRDGPLPEGEVRDFFRQILAGLEAAHAKGVVHGDLKSNNIILAHEPGGALRPVITDFGLARPVEGATLAEAGGGKGSSFMGGTVEYMAPELLKGQRASIASDLYAFGVILHEMVIGSRPESAGRMAPGLPQRWKRVIARCLQSEPSKRFAGAREALVSIDSDRLRGVRSVQSLVVLPFVNMSGDKENEYFSDGMTEELINALANVEGLRVASRTSSFAFKGKNLSIRRIGEELSVGAVLEGSVRREGDRLRITAQLINVADDNHIWSKTYDRELKSLFALEEDIARSIANALERKLVAVKAATTNLDAHDLYLRGLYFLNRRTASALAKAAEHFEQAIAQDPRYALAYVGLADATQLRIVHDAVAPAEVLPRAKAAALRALALDPALAEAHASMGQIYHYDYEMPAALQEFRTALALKPDYPSAHQWYGESLLALGRLPEAQAELDRGLQLDPASSIIKVSRTDVLLCARDYQGALAQFRKVLEMDPGFNRAHRDLALLYAFQGKYVEALAELDKMREEPGVRLQLYRARVYALSGRSKESLELARGLEDRSLREYVSHSDIGLLWLALHDKDRAFAHFMKACEVRDPELIYVKVSPAFDAVRADPRFKDLLRCLHLE